MQATQHTPRLRLALCAEEHTDGANPLNSDPGADLQPS